MAMTLEDAVKAYLQGWTVLVNDGAVSAIVKRKGEDE